MARSLKADQAVEYGIISYRARQAGWTTKDDILFYVERLLDTEGGRFPALSNTRTEKIVSEVKRYMRRYEGDN